MQLINLGQITRYPKTSPSSLESTVRKVKKVKGCLSAPHMRARYATTLILFVSHNYVCEPFRSTHKHLLTSDWSRARPLHFLSYETLIIHLVCLEWVAVCVDFDGIAQFFLQPSSGLGKRAGDSRGVE